MKARIALREAGNLDGIQTSALRAAPRAAWQDACGALTTSDISAPSFSASQPLPHNMPDALMLS